MPDNLKFQLERSAGEARRDDTSLKSETSEAAETARADDAEAQMRRALGLLGGPPRPRHEPDRTESSSRMSERIGGSSHRRRFVQDGDVPVTVVRRDQGHEAQAQRAAHAAAAPGNGRLQRVEAALAAETAGRERAERSLHEMQSQVRDLQTKIGHADLARKEAEGAVKREQEAVHQLRQDHESLQDELQALTRRAQVAERQAQFLQEQLQEELGARKTIEAALLAAEADRSLAQQAGPDTPVAQMAAMPGASPLRPVRAEAPDVGLAPRRRRVADPVAAEPEPVKWWLIEKPRSRRR